MMRWRLWGGFAFDKTFYIERTLFGKVQSKFVVPVVRGVGGGYVQYITYIYSIYYIQRYERKCNGDRYEREHREHCVTL